MGDEPARFTLLDFLVTRPTPSMSTESTVEKRCCPELTFHHVADPLASVAVKPDGKLLKLKFVIDLKGPIAQIQQFYDAVIQLAVVGRSLFCDTVWTTKWVLALVEVRLDAISEAFSAHYVIAWGKSYRSTGV